MFATKSQWAAQIKKRTGAVPVLLVVTEGLQYLNLLNGVLLELAEADC